MKDEALEPDPVFFTPPGSAIIAEYKTNRIHIFKVL